jgi:hypothetical protein
LNNDADEVGLPFNIGKSKKEAFQAILARVLGKIEGWRAKTLSQKIVASNP